MGAPTEVPTSTTRDGRGATTLSHASSVIGDSSSHFLICAKFEAVSAWREIRRLVLRATSSIHTE
jgi:hypothetical protein